MTEIVWMSHVFDFQKPFLQTRIESVIFVWLCVWQGGGGGGSIENMSLGITVCHHMWLFNEKIWNQSKFEYLYKFHISHSSWEWHGNKELAFRVLNIWWLNFEKYHYKDFRRAQCSEPTPLALDDRWIYSTN